MLIALSGTKTRERAARTQWNKTELTTCFVVKHMFLLGGLIPFPFSIFNPRYSHKRALEDICLLAINRGFYFERKRERRRTNNRRCGRGQKRRLTVNYSVSRCGDNTRGQAVRLLTIGRSKGARLLPAGWQQRGEEKRKERER